MNTTACRIAHVITESGPFGGAQRNTLLTLEGLARDGWTAELICGEGGRLIEEARQLGIPVHVLPELVRQVAPRNDCCALVHLYQLYRSRRYHIVHTHSTKAGLLGRVAACWARVPVILHTIHGYPFVLDGGLRTTAYIALERLVGSVTDRVICVGEILRQEVSAWKLAPQTKLITIYSGIDFSSYVPQRAALAMKHELGLENAWPIVGSVGHLVEAKAQHDLVEAVGLLTAQYPRIALLLVGEGHLRPSLERQVRDLGLTPNVFLLGERDDIADLLNVLDIYAMSSRREGVGRALTEAMYWGLPMVGTSINGVTELIHHEETGLCVPPRDPRALASAINRLAADHVLARRLGESAERMVRELMDSRRMIKAIEELYTDLMWSKHSLPEHRSSLLPPHPHLPPPGGKGLMGASPRRNVYPPPESSPSRGEEPEEKVG